MKMNSAFGPKCPACKRAITSPSPPAWACQFCPTPTPICVWCYANHTAQHHPNGGLAKPTWEERQKEIAEAKRIAMETGVPVIVSQQRRAYLDVEPGAEYEINPGEGTITKTKDPE
jgi:hypothetical protein